MCSSTINLSLFLLTTVASLSAEPALNVNGIVTKLNITFGPSPTPMHAYLVCDEHHGGWATFSSLCMFSSKPFA